MIYLFIIACICVYAFMPDCTVLGVTNDTLSHAFCYQFAHGSWIHLGINSLCLVMMFKPILKAYEERCFRARTFAFLFATYLGSSLAALFTSQDIPTVGSSGIVFFLLGALLMLRPTLRQLQSYIYVAIAIIVQIIRGKSNVALHLVAFVLGALFIIISLLCKYNKERYESLGD